MASKARFFATGSLTLFSAAVLSVVAGPAQAAPFIVTLNTNYSGGSASFNFFGETFTFSGTGDIFAPTAITTAGGAAVRSFGGFLGIPVSPSTDFPARGSGILSYGPGTSFASFDTKTTIPYSNGDNYLGLRVTQGGLNYYGYAFTTNTTLNSFGFETSPNTAFVINTNPATAVPEPASWALMVAGFGIIGGALRQRRKLGTRFA